MGIDAVQPRLSWQMESPTRGQRQTAYEILVASSPKLLAGNRGDLWNTGKIPSDQSVAIHYAGKPLASHTLCFWKVRVWDKDGSASSWSEPATWTMGILRPEDWHAEWIGLDGEETTNYLAGTSWIWFPRGEPQRAAAPATNYFRKIVILPPDRKIVRATFVYTGDDECRGWLNGSDLGAIDHFRSVKDNDITGRLEPGTTNVFAFTGIHRGGKGANLKPAGIVGLLTIQFETGDPMVIPTDASWKVSEREAAGWNRRGFNDTNWVAAKVLGTVGMEPWGRVRTAESRRLPARYLRKEFYVPKTIVRATVSFCGLGLSELYLNGDKVGDAVLSPAFSQYNKRAYYVTYDVTKYLHSGDNAMGVILGNGRFYADRSKVFGGTDSFGWPKLLLQLRLEYTDGSVSEIVSDGSWKMTTDGPIVANNDYDGEEYDARKEFPGWATTNFNAALWFPARTVMPASRQISAQMMAPIRVTDTIKPVAITEASPGVYIFDMGQNMVGWCRLRVLGERGTVVRLRFGETLKADGTLNVANLRSAQATDVYILRGSEFNPEVWEPRFVTHGFRYVEISGYPGTPLADALTACVVNDDLRPAGDFETSNPLLNRIYQAAVWGTRGNYRSIPTDCPQRDERQGWLGDRAEESRGETYIYDNENLYAKWLRDIADAQKPDGAEPDVAPAYWPIYSDDVSWPSTAIIIPEMLREQFGDTAAIAQQYDSAREWMHYMSRSVTNGIISKDRYGDWCVPPEDPALIHSQDTNRITDKTLIATAFFYHDCKLMADYATLLKKPADAREYEALAKEIKTAFNKKFLDEKKDRYDNGTQTSCILPLAFGLVPEEQMLHARIFNHLVSDIVTNSNGHLRTGLIGGQYLMEVLTDNGRADLAYQLATQNTYPSWGYMIAHGATTIWELWNGNTADPT
ncbi:MAG TPA: family 78 glycoside hydrolase catalytic domain, partial [Verrucomicrobiae bacterium]|nr:family 78 glycoside hydrolase catalytic domain [Verrucomicrobiae bacterium]